MPASAISPAFEKVCLNYSSAMLRRIRLMVRDNSVEKDLMQECLLKMWRKWPTYDRQKGSLFTWTILITTSTCIDYLRAARGIIWLDVQSEFISQAPRFLSESSTAMLRQEFLRLIDCLPKREREVVNLIYFKGHTQKETSALLKVPLGTIKSRNRTALINLRKLYE